MRIALNECLLVALVVGTSNAFTSSPSALCTRTSTRLNAEGDGDMSQALPFLPRPKHLDGSLAGDVGFDPFGFGSKDEGTLVYMREAEIKHSRLAMLAAVGWPLAELFDKTIANSLNLPVALTKSGASPSLLNGGLEKIEPEYWVVVASIAGLAELSSQEAQEEKGKDYTPGDCLFDPLDLFPKDKAGQLEMQTKEIKHGRVAMMAILGFAIQEALYSTPVTAQTPFFFTPIWN
mmetsp:Transcript_64601/g.76488  ORF Transcript_64601/g.76488 Transcript_64601/m.76488 type:complete len:234 (+) Transcript_64601:705-1406(+)